MIQRSDTIVLGGGMAGFSAAIAAARNGAKVLLIERGTMLGGLAVNGMVTPFLGLKDRTGRRIIAGNLDEIRQTIEQFFSFSIEDWCFDTEAMGHALDILADLYQIDILFDTVVTGVEMNDNRLSGINIFNKSGFKTIHAACFIDATGDADVAVMAGLPWEQGRESDHQCQAYTLRFAAGSLVDAAAVKQWLDQRDGSAEFADLLSFYAHKHDVPIYDKHFQSFAIPGRENSLVFNVPRILGINGVDGDSLSMGYRMGRRLIRAYLDLLQNNVPGCQHAVITNTARLLGTRETRRFQGAIILTGSDVADGRRFEDGICGNCWWIDIHNPTGKGVSEMIAPANGFNDVPYRALYSDAVANLWVAGRCISTDHRALASVRITPTCVATGQAAGTAAALALKYAVSACDIDVQELRHLLVKDGALISGINL